MFNLFFKYHKDHVLGILFFSKTNMTLLGFKKFAFVDFKEFRLNTNIGFLQNFFRGLTSQFFKDQLNHNRGMGVFEG